MFELTVTSVQSASQQVEVTLQKNRLSRWWMRHYHHIGLVSIAGSGILVCIMGVMLLPIIVSNSSQDGEQCVTSIIYTTTNSPHKTSVISTTPDAQALVYTRSLCAANATWNSQGVTVAGSFQGENSLSASQLTHPNDLLVDADGNLFIADSGNNRIIYWPYNATQGRIVAGRGIVGSWSNLLKYPSAIVAWKKKLYVSDLGNGRLLAFPLSKIEDSPDGITIVGRHGIGTSLHQIDSVYYMSIGTTRELFYLSDFGNNRVLKLNLTTSLMELLVVTGILDSVGNSFNSPLGITVDQKNGALYVADSGNNRIVKINLNSTQGTIVAGGNGVGSSLFQLDSPSAVEIDPNGNLYIVDSRNHRIIQWLAQAQHGRVIAGTGSPGIASTQLNYPVQLKFDSNYNIYVVDQNNNRIQRFDLLRNKC